jgi:hypothetical protein
MTSSQQHRRRRQRRGPGRRRRRDDFICRSYRTLYRRGRLGNIDRLKDAEPWTLNTGGALSLFGI